MAVAEGVIAHRATLMGRDRQLAVDLLVDSTSFILKHRNPAPPGAQPVIAKIAYPYVHKVCKASERSVNRGNQRMLDVVIRTNQGLKDLRVALNSPQAVDQVMNTFRVYCARFATVSLSSMEATASLTGTPAASQFGSLAHAHMALSERLDSSRSAMSAPFPNAMGDSSTPSSHPSSPRGRGLQSPPPTPTPHTTPLVPSMELTCQPSLSLSTMEITALQRMNTSPGDEKGADLVARPLDSTIDKLSTRQTVSLRGGVPDTDSPKSPLITAEVAPEESPKAPQEATDSTQQKAGDDNRARISSTAGDTTKQDREQIEFLEQLVTRLSSQLAGLQQSAPAGDAGPPASVAQLGAQVSCDDLMASPLQALLLAYDTNMSELEAKLDNSKLQVCQFEQRIDELVQERDSIRARLEDAMKVAASKAACDGGNADLERVAMVHRENDLLTAQNAELDSEVIRLQHELQQATQRCMDLSQECGTLSVRLKAAETETGELRDTSMGQDAVLTELRGTVEVLSGAEDAARQRAAEVEQVRGDLDELARTHQELQAAHTDALAAANALKLELEGSRESLSAAMNTSACHEGTAAELRAELADAQARIHEFQVKDAEVYTRIREAMEAAEQSKLAKEASEARAHQLDSALDDLRSQVERLSAAASARSVTDASDAEAAQKQLEESRRAVRALEERAADLAGTVERLEREKKGLQEQVTANQGAAMRTPVMDVMETLQRALEAEKDASLTKQELAGVKRELSRNKLEADVLIRQLEGQLEDCRLEMNSLQASYSSSQQEAGGLARQLDCARKELESIKVSRKMREDELQAAMASLHGERKAEVKMLAGKLEDSIRAYNDTVVEAERMLQAKEDLLKRYKQEAQSITKRLKDTEAALASRDEQLSAYTTELNEVRGMNEELRMELQGAIVGVEEGRTAVQRAQRATHEAARLRSRRDEEVRRRRALELELDQVQLMKDRVVKSPARSPERHDRAGNMLIPATKW